MSETIESVVNEAYQHGFRYAGRVVKDFICGELKKVITEYDTLSLKKPILKDDALLREEAQLLLCQIGLLQQTFDHVSELFELESKSCGIFPNKEI